MYVAGKSGAGGHTVATGISDKKCLYKVPHFQQ